MAQNTQNKNKLLKYPKELPYHDLTIKNDFCTLKVSHHSDKKKKKNWSKLKYAFLNILK